MKAWRLFAEMPPALAARIFAGLAQHARGEYAQLIEDASRTLSMRTKALRAQPAAARARLLQRALAQVRSNEAAGDILAAYFLSVRKAWLCNWLDALNIEHEAGVLTDPSPPEPARAELESALQTFHAQARDENQTEAETKAERILLLETFAAQESIDWPALETLIANPE